jgi:poly-D-alanine transfer protein DltD
LVDVELKVFLVLSRGFSRKEYLNSTLFKALQLSLALIELEGKKVVFIDPPVDGLFLWIPNFQGLAFAIDLFHLFDDYLTKVDFFLS